MAAILSAKNHEDKGFYGNLNFLYSDDEYITSSARNTEEKFLKELRLGYSGNIYSPGLLEYTVEGALRFEDREMQRKSYSSKDESEGVEYKSKFDFIKNTKFPFSVYANKSERPTSTIYNAYTETYINETRGEGVNGSINLNPYVITYGASNMKNIVETNSGLEDSNIASYYGALNYKNKVNEAEVRYDRYIEENQYYYSSSTLLPLDRVKDSVNLSYSYSGVEDLMLSSGASYERDAYFMSESTDANLNLYWRPKNERYDAMFSAYGSKMEIEGQDGYEGYLFNSINLSQGFNYRLSDSITLSENATLYTYDATSVKGSSSYINLYGTHSYNRTFFTDIPFSLTTRLGVQKNDSTSKSTSILGTTTTISSVERYNLNLMPRAKKELPSIKSTLNFNGGYNSIIASNKENEQRYDVRLLLLSKVWSAVNNNLSADYYKTDRVSVSVLDGEKTKSSYSAARLMEMLDFYFNLGIRGQIRFKAGAEYVNRKSDNQSESSVNPRGEASMNYRLFRSWLFSASARISEMYNTLDNSWSANLTFNAGKTSFSMGYQYNKSEVDSLFGDLSNERSMFRAQLTRSF